MRRLLIVMLTGLVACTCAGAPALAAPNADHASCSAILSSADAHLGIRDDVARFFASADFPPGVIYSSAAHARATTPEECEEAIGGP